MDENLVLTEADVNRLEHFHAAHFPGQRTPSLQQARVADGTAVDTGSEIKDKDLGFYADGIKRTLTDDQIAMFRNSEIQRLLQERRKAKEAEEEEEDRNYKHKKNKGNHCQERRKGDQSRTTHVDDQPRDVDTLMYDEEPNSSTQSATGPKTFFWPKLGW